MLISKTAEVKWNSRNKKRYIDLGYTFTRMGDLFVVDVNDLSDGSNSVVTLKCDYCGKEYSIQWETYKRIHKRTIIDKDACGDCCEKKANDAIESKYGSHTDLFFSCNDARIKTNLSRYGCENVFGSDVIKDKIVQTNIERYGCEHNQSNPNVRAKTRNTCMERYGVENYIELFKGKFIKENSPVWKGGVEHSRVERATYEYNQWRKDVFGRDMYTCQCCGAHSGGGSEVVLNAHHILNWRDNVDCRYDIDNGITLCKECHTLFHSVYGKSHTDIEQLHAFINDMRNNELDKKVC